MKIEEIKEILKPFIARDHGNVISNNFTKPIDVIAKALHEAMEVKFPEEKLDVIKSFGVPIPKWCYVRKCWVFVLPKNDKYNKGYEEQNVCEDTFEKCLDKMITNLELLNGGE